MTDIDMSMKNNRRVLTGLLAIQNRAVDLEFQLKVEGKEDEATQLGEAIDELEIIIRTLRGKILDNWTDQIPNLRADLMVMNGEVQIAMDDIEDDVQTAERVVELFGKLDKAIKLLGPLLL